MARQHQPDVVLMDLRMPGAGGLAAIRQLPADQPGVRVVVLTTYDSDADILPAVEAGAAGYLLKDTPRDTLVGAIFAAARGETVLAPTVAGRLVNRLRAAPPEAPAARETLSARETEVLILAGRGLTNADRPGTVRQRGHGEDPPAPGLRQAGGVQPDRRRHPSHGTRGPAVPQAPLTGAAEPAGRREPRCPALHEHGPP
jgi:hypothetical protein